MSKIPRRKVIIKIRGNHGKHEFKSFEPIDWKIKRIRRRF